MRGLLKQHQKASIDFIIDVPQRSINGPWRLSIGHWFFISLPEAPQPARCMKKPKNRRKLLRTKCLNCHQVEDSLQENCSKCGNAFFTEESLELLDELKTDVDALEVLLASLEDPNVKHQNPYTPVDESFKLIRKLRANQQIPGLADYLVAARSVLLPYKVAVLRKTFRANSLVLMMLCIFPLVPLFLGWAPIVPLLLALPVLVWGYLLYRTRNDLLKAEQDIANSET